MLSATRLRFHLFLAVIVLIIKSDMIMAQTFQTVYSNRIASFQGHTLRIDSIVAEEDSIFFPMNYIQQNEPGCYTPFGNSWIGEKIIIRPDGMNLFLTKDHDTVRINTDAGLGESWVAYKLDSSLQITATVTKFDTLSFLGVNDSVKWIDFQVYDSTLSPIDHLINEKYLLLSKKYGLIHTLSFNYFPYFNHDDLNFYSFNYTIDMDLSGLDPPGLGYTNLTWFEVYDFSPGDELHILNESSYSDNTEYSSLTDKTIYRYLVRTDVDQEINYSIERIYSRITESEDGISSVYTHDTISTTYDKNDLFSTLPGEPVIVEDYAWSYKLGYGLDVTKTEPSPYEFIGLYDDICWWEGCCWDGCFPAYTYIKGLGGPYYQCESSFMGYYSVDERLVYYKKGQKTWGTPLIITSIEDPVVSERIRLFPNPASHHCSVSVTPDNLPGKLRIQDLSGRLIMQEEINSEMSEIDLKGIPRGMYLVVFINMVNKQSTIPLSIK